MVVGCAARQRRRPTPGRPAYPFVTEVHLRYSTPAQRLRVGLLIATALVLAIAVSVAGQGPGDEPGVREEGRALQTSAVADTRIPESFDTLYVFPDLTNDNTPEDLIATVIHCSNLSEGLESFEVQLFEVTATDVYTARVDVSAGRTWTFATQNPAIYTVDTTISAELIQSGYGPILSTDTSTLCVTQLVDPANTQPVFLTNLPLVDVRGRQIFLPLTPNR